MLEQLRRRCTSGIMNGAVRRDALENFGGQNDKSRFPLPCKCHAPPGPLRPHSTRQNRAGAILWSRSDPYSPPRESGSRLAIARADHEAPSASSTITTR
jgi:hypothetical protein